MVLLYRKKKIIATRKDPLETEDNIKVNGLTIIHYFDTVHSIELWRTNLFTTPFPDFLVRGNTSVTNLVKLPVGLFTTVYTSQLITPIWYGTELLFLLVSLISLFFVYTLHRSYAIRYHQDHLSLVQDILNHEQFLALKKYRHHTNHIYDHVLRVSYVSYRISKSLGLDYVAAARGGLLHDFFLYDWRERKAHDEKRSTHGKEHPFIALANAQQYFTINDKEADIIVKHMFPKTHALPLYPESVVVNISDKVSAIFEYLHKKR